ncbi:MAG: hypothetical protein ACRD10_15365 [Terriglobia bacterium]
MKLPLVLFMCLLACPHVWARQHLAPSYTIQLPPAPNFNGLAWLAGQWSGKTAGAKPAGTVTLSVSYTLDRRFMLLHESVALLATKAVPATKEEFLGVLGANPTGAGFALDLYSSRGFATRYQVTVKAAEIDFNPAGGRVAPAGWLFRRVITRSSPDACTESESVAPPGQPFFNYYTAVLRRSQAGGLN